MQLFIIVHTSPYTSPRPAFFELFLQPLMVSTLPISLELILRFSLLNVGPNILILY